VVTVHESGSIVRREAFLKTQKVRTVEALRRSRERVAKDDEERDDIVRALRAHGGNKAEAARSLGGMKRTTLIYKIERLGIRPEEYLPAEVNPPKNGNLELPGCVSLGALHRGRVGLKCEGEVASRCGDSGSECRSESRHRSQSASAGAAGRASETPRARQSPVTAFPGPSAKPHALTPRTPNRRPAPSLPFASPVPPS
jgi:hypothetical protein